MHTCVRSLTHSLTLAHLTCGHLISLSRVGRCLETRVRDHTLSVLFPQPVDRLKDDGVKSQTHAHNRPMEKTSFWSRFPGALRFFVLFFELSFYYTLRLYCFVVFSRAFLLPITFCLPAAHTALTHSHLRMLFASQDARKMLNNSGCSSAFFCLRLRAHFFLVHKYCRMALSFPAINRHFIGGFAHVCDHGLFFRSPILAKRHNTCAWATLEQLFLLLKHAFSVEPCCR